MPKKEKCKYKLKDGVYYMVCDGKEVPVDIDAPPMFRADMGEKVVAQIIAKKRKKEEKQDLEDEVGKKKDPIFDYPIEPKKLPKEFIINAPVIRHRYVTYDPAERPYS